MTRTTIRALGSALVMMGGCHTTPKAALPSDLPPPEYETPRGYDLEGATKVAAPTATAAPTAPPPPAPTTTPRG